MAKDTDLVAALAGIESRLNTQIATAIGSNIIPSAPGATPTAVPTVKPRIRMTQPPPEISFLENIIPPPVPVPPVVPTTTEVAPAGFGSIQDLAQETVPTVDPITGRSIPELRSIAAMLAPQVEAAPLTREQLLGIGSQESTLGLFPEDVARISSTRLAQLQTKASIDQSALDFLRESTGQKTAEELVKDKVAEEGAVGRQKFATESAAAEAVKAANRQAKIENRRSKVALAQTFLKSRADAAAKAAGPVGDIDIWKAKKASILTKLADTDPLLAAGITHVPDVDESIHLLKLDTLASGPEKMADALRKFHEANVAAGTPPIDTNPFKEDE